MTSSDVANSYDTITKSHEGDLSSAKTPFRNFNNFVKKQLIKASLNTVRAKDPKRRGAAVLDLASGRGGDIGKWLFAKGTGRGGVPSLTVSQYHCLDISSESIKEAERRYKTFENPSAEATFEVADCFSDEFLLQTLPSLPLYQQYSVVTIQFSFHYACENEKRIEKVIKAIAGALHPGGVFIATTVNEGTLATYVQEKPHHAMFSINMIEPVEWVTSFQTKKTLLKIGSRYHFQLEGFVNSPEYVVPMLVTKKHAASAGLVESADFSKGFDAFLEDYNSGWNPSRLELSEEELELIKLYRTMFFIKEEVQKFGSAGTQRYSNASHQYKSYDGESSQNGSRGRGGFQKGRSGGGFGNAGSMLSRDMWGKS